MADELIPFQFESSAVRVVNIDGEAWFVARDVATALGYAKPRNAIAEHCKDARIQGIPSAGGVQQMTIISERDVYRLIMRSKLPSAERFEEWVVGDVLPSIRKTGSYHVNADPERAMIAAWIRDHERRERESLTAGSEGARALNQRKREKPVLENERRRIVRKIQLSLIEYEEPEGDDDD